MTYFWLYCIGLAIWLGNVARHQCIALLLSSRNLPCANTIRLHGMSCIQLSLGGGWRIRGLFLLTLCKVPACPKGLLRSPIKISAICLSDIQVAPCKAAWLRRKDRTWWSRPPSIPDPICLYSVILYPEMSPPCCSFQAPVLLSTEHTSASGQGFGSSTGGLVQTVLPALLAHEFTAW